MKDYYRIIEDALSCALEGDIPDKLREAMRYSLLAGGKRLRPQLCLAACDMLSDTIEPALPLALGIEMIHTYSLIHDDLPAMDDDDFRRGKPSSHKAFGEANAILAGDALLTEAFELALTRGKEEELVKLAPRYYEAVGELAHGAGARGMVAGQIYDVEPGKKTADELIKTDGLKTGALIIAAVRAGAVAGGADKAQLERLSEFARLYGLLFQVTDDIIDFAGGEVGGFPTVIGEEASRELARSLASDAKAALAMFGDSAAFFTSLIDATVGRRA